MAAVNRIAAYTRLVEHMGNQMHRLGLRQFGIPGLALVTLLFAPAASAYEPDKAARKAISASMRAELIEATPRPQRFSVRFAISGRTPFRDYERLAKRAGYEPYTDCSIATFVEITHWQIIQRADLDPVRIAELHAACEGAESTVLGAKPLSQETGDRAIMRGMWQRSLEFVGKGLRDEALLQFVRADAAAEFTQLYGDPDQFELGSDGFVARSGSVAPDSATPETMETPPGPDRPEPQTEPVFTASNASAASPVDRLVLRTVTRYGLSGVYVENATYLLLQDGSIFRKPYENPYSMDVPASKRSAAKDWGTWERRGEELIVTWPGDEPDVWKTWFTVRPADGELQLSGRFQSADAFGGDRVANFNTVAFTPDGRFSWANLKGGNTAWLPAYSDTRKAGRYTLIGNAIRLEFNDGAVREYAFGFYPKDEQHFVIGSSHFTPLN